MDPIASRSKFWDFHLKLLLFPLQLTPKDAFKLCRYDWMREALKNFLTSLPEDKMNEMREELVEFSMMPVPDAAKERPILSSGRFGKTSVMQRLEGSYNKVTVQA